MAREVKKEESFDRWKMMVFNKQITEDESLEFYDTWAENYDADQVNLGFKRQFNLAAKMAELFPDKTVREFVRILDVASGTGLVGEGLKAVGFESIDAVDGSPGMIDKLMAKGLYKNAWVVRLGGSSDRIHPEIPDNSYDVAVIMGGFAQSHLPPDCLYQVARSIKKGGLFINLMTKKYLDIVDNLKILEPLMEKMESEGIWKKLEVYTDNVLPNNNRWHIYRKL